MARLRTALLLAFLLVISPTAHGDFPLKDGDVWVMAGDSITAQHLHSNYFEAFCYARYPKMKFAFRNSGVGGHTIPSTLARFDYDIAAWKPTVVSVELGMNDQGGTPTEKFVANMKTMVQRIRAINARPIIFSASPINNGDTMTKLAGNKRLNDYAVALKEYAASEKIPYADQFHALLDIWGKNKPNELRLTQFFTIKGIAGNDKLPGVEHLKEFLAVNEKDIPSLISMGGDPVHPGAPGQLMMAAALLRELGAESFVSSAVIDAVAASAEAKGCKISGIKATSGGVAFERLDECLPFPIPDDARSVLKLYPTILDLSQYTLKVTGLKSGKYALKINDATVATLSSQELQAGINLTALGSDPKSKIGNPIAAQSKAILGAVSARAGLVGQWRGMSKQLYDKKLSPADLQSQLAAQTKKVEEGDERIREAAQAKSLRFELTAQ